MRMLERTIAAVFAVVIALVILVQLDSGSASMKGTRDYELATEPGMFWMIIAVHAGFCLLAAGWAIKPMRRD